MIILEKAEITQATKQKIALSLKRFMEKKSFEKITVKDILEDCNITRPTFYYHFEDMYDLLRWTFETEAVELLRASENCVDWDDGILLLLEYVHKHHQICLCAYKSVGRDLLKKMFYDSSNGIMRRFVDNLLTDIPAKQEHIEFICGFYTQAFTSCLITWMLDGEPNSPEEMIKLLDITMHGNVAAALKRSAETK